MVEEVGDAGEEAGGEDAVVVGFGEQGAEEGSTGTLAFGFGNHDNGADLGEVRAVQMKRAAAEELRFGLDF